MKMNLALLASVRTFCGTVFQKQGTPLSSCVELNYIAKRSGMAPKVRYNDASKKF